MTINCEIAFLTPTLCIALVGCAVALAASIDATTNVDVAPFGFARRAPNGAAPIFCPQVSDGDSGAVVDVTAGDAIHVEWKQPRDIETVILRGPKLPDPASVEVQWWYRIWPDNGRGGWMRLDDPFNGNWVTVKAAAKTADGALTWEFPSLEKDENPQVEQIGARYRRTYKIRLVFSSPARISAVEAYTAAEWRTAELRFQWKPKSGQLVPFTGRIEARNGRVLSTEIDGKTARIKVRYAHSPDRLSEDRGYVVFRSPGVESFSVFVDDVLREGGVYVRDIDAFVSDASRNLTYSNWSGPADRWDATIMEQVAAMPEQSLQRVMQAIPRKPPREAHLGVANLRQEFTITELGNIALEAKSLRAPGRDLDRRPWTCNEVRFALACGENPRFDWGTGREVTRWLEDGWLPVIHTQWEDDGIRYSQAAFATTLMEGIGENESRRRGDEPLVLLDRIELENTEQREKTACLWLENAPNLPMRIEDGVLVLEKPSDGKPRDGLTPVRGRIDTNGKGELAYVPDYKPIHGGSPDPEAKDPLAPRAVVRYSVKLAPGEKHTVYISIPYIELLDDAELSALKHARFDRSHDEVVAYWRKRAAEGMQYEVPEQVLNDLFNANLWHVLITTDRDPFTGLYEHGAATMHYRIYANETGMVAQSLAMRGMFEEAYRLIDPFLVCQGVKPLPGNFKSKDGLMYAAHPVADPDPYTAQGYNMHHGWALWNLCEHYKWTRDREWLASAAPKLIAACDWITRERQATKVMNPDGTKPVEWGLAPAGDLEDVEEYLYFYATNAYYYIGLRSTAEVLAETGHSEAARLAKDADDYKADIMESVRESVATSPVVRLKDGTYVPYVPPRAYALTHQKEGWIREGLYPALHLLDANLVEPHHPYMDWLLQDLEDNIFLSDESGYHVDDLRKQFFDFGGFNLQPNLLTNSFAHLRRDEIPNFLRVFWNECWASLYPDTMCFAEWVRKFGEGGGPLYKTPDECKFVQYMRNMLVFEEGDTLKLGMGVPRAWMADGKRVRIERAATFFGMVDMTIESHVSDGRITATLTLPTRTPAQTLLRLRHADGKRMRRVTIDGKEWTDFDAERELITLPKGAGKVKVVGEF